jgi:hypothetical protein
LFSQHATRLIVQERVVRENSFTVEPLERP